MSFDRRKGVSGRQSRGQFNRRAGKTHRRNMLGPLRGGIRL